MAGKNLLKYAGHIPPDDLKAMSEAIERSCGEVDADEWEHSNVNLDSRNHSVA